jgi:hypothetical protein
MGQVADLGARLGSIAEQERQGKRESDAAAIESLLAEDAEAGASGRGRTCAKILTGR